MNNSLQAFLGFDKAFPIGKFVCIRECSSFSSDGWFVLNHMLMSSLRAGKSVCLISFSQSESHFSHVCSKSSTNLQAYAAKNKYKIIDGLKMIRSTNDYSTILRDVFHTLREICESFNVNINNDNKVDQDIVILIDNISTLLNICETFVEVIDFFNYVKSYVLDKHLKGSLCVLAEECDEVIDEHCYKLQCYLANQSDIQVTVKGLDSGFCKDIHGELIVQHKYSISSVMQFKVEDRNIKLFPTGTSTAVLGSHY